MLKKLFGRNKRKEYLSDMKFMSDENKKKLKECINKICDKIELYQKVREHIVNGGPALGIVWEYSPYMTLEEVDASIKDLTDILVYLKTVYSELISNNDLIEIDLELQSLIDLQFKTISIENNKKIQKAIDDINKKFL